MHQAQKSCAVFAQKFKFSSLAEENPGKEGHTHLEIVLMKRGYPRWEGIHSCPYSSFFSKKMEQDQPKELVRNKRYSKNISDNKLYQKYMNLQ